MDKKDILDRYFLEEIDTKGNEKLTGWIILGEIPTNKYLDNKTVIHVKTRNDAWLDEFEIVLLSKTGLVLVSPECPQRYIEDNLERDILGIMSQLYITESSFSIVSDISTITSSSPYRVWCGDSCSSGNSIANSITDCINSGNSSICKLSNNASNNISIQ